VVTILLSIVAYYVAGRGFAYTSAVTEPPINEGAMSVDFFQYHNMKGGVTMWVQQRSGQGCRKG